MTAAMTIPELFDAAAEAVPDKDWLFWEDERYTYAQAATATWCSRPHATSPRTCSRGWP
jgi:hypothetical protein